MTIDQLTHAAVIKGDMRIPVSLYGQTMRINVSQLQTSGSGTVNPGTDIECMTPEEVTALCNSIFNA